MFYLFLSKNIFAICFTAGLSLRNNAFIQSKNNDVSNCESSSCKHKKMSKENRKLLSMKTVTVINFCAESY